jgi:membrane protease YdiL (CAAX protease family)
MPLADAALSALLNVAVLAGVPFLIYWLYHRRRHKRSLVEVARRAGLQPGEPRYIGYCAAVAAVVVAALVIWPPQPEPFLREKSPQRPFIGLGLSAEAIAMALLYGVVKTGFAEELLFRGLIAGSLSRRMSLPWANLTQAVIFLLPHLPILFVMPEMWWVLPLVFVTALFMGWARIKSGSILGPWLAHAAANVTVCLSVAARTAL